MNDTLGIILTGIGDADLGDLTRMRSVAALPIFGRYRLIDFLVSSMVNSGITNVGVSTLSIYRSLMDHLGSGKEWDLSRKLYGLFILPPFMGNKRSDTVTGDMDILDGITDYLTRSKQEYVMLCGSHAVLNTTFYELRDQHIDSGADITVMCCKQPACPPNHAPRFASLTVDETGRVTDMRARAGLREEEYRCMDIWFMKKSFLTDQIAHCAAHGLHDFVMDVVIRNLDTLNIRAYKYDGPVGMIDSPQDYYRESMRLLNLDAYKALFPAELPIYTKIKDQVPSKYSTGAKVRNSIVADGCTIEGTVENCILFRGVEIAKGAYVRDSIIMQNTVIGENARLNCVILDKNVVVGDGKQLSGQSSYPVVVHKNSEI